MLAGIDVSAGLLGLFLALPLLAMTRSRPANGWLGLFILSISLLSLAFPVYARFPQLFGLFDWPLAGVGAFFYCYVRSLTGLGNARRQRWHFLPLALLVCALAYGRSRLSGIDLLRLLLDGSRPLFNMLLLGFQMLAGAYALAALYRLRQYRQRLRVHYSSIDRRELHWLSWLSLSFITLLILWFPANLVGGYWQLLLILGRLVTLYFVGWFGLRQTAVFTSRIGAGEADKSVPENATGADKVPVAPPVEPASPAEPSSSGAADALASHKYARSGMTNAASALIGRRLERWVADARGYLNPDIRLTDLAECIGTSPQLVSQYLNDVLGLSFFDYINGLRVAAIQEMMRDRANDTRTLLELAFAAGFSSKSTFNASFKKISGLAPSSWRSQHARTSAPIG
ncbi:AraC family transcriptional regulator [Massilia sp. IC2-278]|uniref:helix-turn-helix domain-containing protein n=1 Tax=Massilia sp. IC2-278 TaxID=2887200 RepID=UPI001E632FB4|nr:AraC family transcriptional regulator [Massilia sp. IC2-278]MCC2962825.1 AraC family transcriptional regulator [Massilia sp. IC2-278]